MDANIPGTPDPMVTSRGMERIDTHWHEPERDIVFDKVGYAHEGFFEFSEFRPLIRRWAKQYDYIADELQNVQRVEEHGRIFKIHMLFQKKMSDMHFAILRMDIKFLHMTDMPVTINGRDREVQHGKVQVVINGFVMGFERYAWEGKAVFAFLHGVVDKFVYKLRRGRYAKQVIADGKAMINELRGYFELSDQRLKDQIDTEKEKKEVEPELKKPPAKGEDEVSIHEPVFREFDVP